MRASELSTAQIKQLRDSLKPKLDYMTKDLRRMEETHFPREDILYLKARRAQESAHEFVAELNHMLDRHEVFGTEPSIM